MWQGAMGPLGHVGRRNLGAARRPMWPFHITYPWESLPKASPPLIQCRFASKAKMESPWIHGSTVIDLEGSNRLPARIIALTAMQPPLGSHLVSLDAEVVEPRAGRRP